MSGEFLVVSASAIRSILRYVANSDEPVYSVDAMMDLSLDSGTVDTTLLFLRRAGHVRNTELGVWQITDQGRERAARSENNRLGNLCEARQELRGPLIFLKEMADERGGEAALVYGWVLGVEARLESEIGEYWEVWINRSSD